MEKVPNSEVLRVLNSLDKRGYNIVIGTLYREEQRMEEQAGIEAAANEFIKRCSMKAKIISLDTDK